MDSIPKVRQILLDEEIGEQVFIDVFNRVFKKECFIYAIIPEWDNELLNRLSNDFITLKKFPLPLLHISPRTIGFLGYMKDVNKHYIFDFYLKSSTIDFLIFSETDVSKLINEINKKNIDIY